MPYQPLLQCLCLPDSGDGLLGLFSVLNITSEHSGKKVSLDLVDMFKGMVSSEIPKRLSSSYLLSNWNVCCMPSFSISVITCVHSYMLTFIVAKLVGINALVDRKGNSTNPRMS